MKMKKHGRWVAVLLIEVACGVLLTSCRTAYSPYRHAQAISYSDDYPAMLARHEVDSFDTVWRKEGTEVYVYRQPMTGTVYRLDVYYTSDVEHHLTQELGWRTAVMKPKSLWWWFKWRFL